MWIILWIVWISLYFLWIILWKTYNGIYIGNLGQLDLYYTIYCGYNMIYKLIVKGIINIQLSCGGNYES